MENSQNERTGIPIRAGGGSEMSFVKVSGEPPIRERRVDSNTKSRTSMHFGHHVISFGLLLFHIRLLNHRKV